MKKTAQPLEGVCRPADSNEADTRWRDLSDRSLIAVLDVGGCG
jgi:hypothetical protein